MPKAGLAWSSTMPQQARCLRRWTSPPTRRTRTDWQCTTGRSLVATRVSILAGRTTIARRAGGSFGSIWFDPSLVVQPIVHAILKSMGTAIKLINPPGNEILAQLEKKTVPNHFLRTMANRPEALKHFVPLYSAI